MQHTIKTALSNRNPGSKGLLTFQTALRHLHTHELHIFSKGAGDHVALLLGGERVEAHGVAGHADGELRVFFRVGDGFFQGFAGHHVYIQVLAAFHLRAVAEINRNFAVRHFAQLRQRQHGVGFEIVAVGAQAARVGTISRRQRRNRTHETSKPSED